MIIMKNYDAFLGINKILVQNLPVELLEKIESVYMSDAQFRSYNRADTDFCIAMVRIFNAIKPNDFVLSLKNQVLNWLKEQNPKFDLPLSGKQIGFANKIRIQSGINILG